ncbi:MAG: hypothetical protein K5773_08255 [Pseudobutyrivibrio sp.]|nr:hypothetical protein [Pseudobutyrivibrio sp.]
MKRKGLGKTIVIIITVTFTLTLAVVFRCGLNLYDRLNSMDKRFDGIESQLKDINEKIGKEKNTDITETTNNEVDNNPGRMAFVCWGDSLTEGRQGGFDVAYPEVIQSTAASNGYNIEVVNEGAPGENTKDIMARTGAMDLIVTANMVIPMNQSEVTVPMAYGDGTVATIRHTDYSTDNYFVADANICGVDGMISYEPYIEEGADMVYYFKRFEEGPEVQVPVGTEVTLSTENMYKDYIPILFIGTNRGFDSPEELIKQQEAIINQYNDSDKFIICGLTSGPPEEHAADNKAMAEHWGSHFVDLRDYLSNPDNLLKYVPELSDIDRQDLSDGWMPACIMVDSTHFNDVGYTMIGECIYDRLIQLGYIHN